MASYVLQRASAHTPTHNTRTGAPAAGLPARFPHRAAVRTGGGCPHLPARPRLPPAAARHAGLGAPTEGPGAGVFRQPATEGDHLRTPAQCLNLCFVVTEPLLVFPLVAGAFGADAPSRRRCCRPRRAYDRPRIVHPCGCGGVPPGTDTASKRWRAAATAAAGRRRRWALRAHCCHCCSSRWCWWCGLGGSGAGGACVTGPGRGR